MKGQLKKEIQEMVRRIDFPIAVYLYESGRIIATSMKARFVIGDEVRNMNLIWEKHGREKLPEEVLNNGSLILYQRPIVCKNDRLTIDAEITSVEMGEEHVIFFVFEQSYKRPFDKKYQQKIPRIMWFDRKQNVLGCNLSAQKVIINVGTHQDNWEENKSQQKRVLESQESQLGKIEEVVTEKGELSFASVNRILLMNKNETHLGVLTMYTLILSAENAQEIIDDAYRENNILNEAVAKSNYIAISWEKGKEGVVNYVSSNISRFGFLPGEFYQGEITWKDLVVPEDYPLFERKNTEPNLYGTNCFFVDYRIRKKNGDILWVRDETIKSTIKDITNFRQGIIHPIETPMIGNQKDSFSALLKGVSELETCPEFSLVYQPIIDSETRTCVGAEALLRWKNKKNKLASPSEFLPLSEYLGLMGPIGKFVFQEAFQALDYWNQNGYPDFRIHINLSVIQLTQSDIIAQVSEAAQTAGIKRENVVFEVKESLALEDVQLMKLVLLSLKKERFRILLDNFGSGVSALSLVMELPLNYIKVDESFIRAYGTEKFKPSLLNAIGGVAHDSGIKVIVAGIETREQLEFLILSDIDEYQGYYFGHPVPVSEFKMKGENK